MLNINIKEIEYSIIENWNEITLGNYIQLVKIYQAKDDMLEEEFLVKFLTLISNIPENVLLKAKQTELMSIVPLMSNFKLDSFVKEKQTHFILNGKDYAVNILDELQLGQIIDIKLLGKTSLDMFDSWLNMLCVIILPAISSKNEFDEIIYTPIDYEGGIDLLMKRKELLKQIPAVNALWIIEAFKNGRN